MTTRTGWTKARVYISEEFGPYEAEVMDDQRWNGFAIPRFTREVVEQMAKDSEELRKVDDDAYAEIRFEGDDVLVIDHNYEGEQGIECITPDADGMYGVGAFAWVWTEVDEDEDASASSDGVRYPEIFIDLIGSDGNAFAVLGAAGKAMRKAGLSQAERDAFMAEATSGDYDHLLATCMRWFDVR